MQIAAVQFLFVLYAYPSTDPILGLHILDEVSLTLSQGPEEMCLPLEHQNLSKTPEKMGYFDRVTVSLHILYTANQETEVSQDRPTV